MAKKVTNEEILERLNEEKIKKLALEEMLFPAMVVSGIKQGHTVTRTLRCPYCGEEYTETADEYSYGYRYNKRVICDVCERTMVGTTMIPEEGTKLVTHLEYLDDNSALYGSSSILYMDLVTIGERKGVLIARYEFGMNWSFGKTIGVQEFSLYLKERAFITETEKFMYNEDGKRCNRNLHQSFYGHTPLELISKQTKNFINNFKCMKDVNHYYSWQWMDEYECSRDVTRMEGYVPQGERKAIETNKRFPCDELPEIPKHIPRIIGKRISEDVVTGRTRRENFCLNCGTVFQDEVRHEFERKTCPNCGYTQEDTYDYRYNDLNREICYISQKGDDTLFLRIVRNRYSFDDVWNVTTKSDEEYRCIILMQPEKEPEIHFMVKEGYGEDRYWVDKKKYASDKIRHNVQEPQYIGGIPLLKYSALKNFLEVKQPGNGYESPTFRDLISFIRFEKTYPVVEQICKRGIVRALAAELEYLSSHGIFRCMDLRCTKVPEALKMSEFFVKMLVGENGTDYALETLQQLYTLDPNMRKEDYAWIRENGLRAEEIARIFAETPMTMMRLCEYLEHVRINQCFDPKQAINDWCDYLRAAKTIDVDLTDNKAKYPSSLKREHDRATAKQRLILDAKKDEFFQAETERYGKLYSYENDEYMIIPPANMKDLFEEGRKLSHCVGSYSDRIIRGESCIMFVRKVSEPEKPYFTIEVNQHNSYVVQLRGLANRSVNRATEKSLILFLREWGNKKHLITDRAF